MGISKKFSASNEPSAQQIDAFVTACDGRRGSLKDVKAFLDKYGDKYVDSRFAGKGSTGLGLALAYSQGPIAEELIARGADVNRRLPQGSDTLLMQSVRNNKPDMVKLLLDKKAAAGAKNERGQTALDIAKRLHFNDVIKILDPAFDTTKAPDAPAVEAYVDAATQNDAAGVRDFINKYGTAHVDAKNLRGFTAMNAVVSRGYTGLIRELHAGGANVNGTEPFYSRPVIDTALDFQRPDAAKVLLSLGAAVDDKTRDIARRHRYDALVQRELDKRETRARHAVDPTVPLLPPTKEEIAEFCSAAGAGDFAGVKAFLAEFGADQINAVGSYGATAVSSAVSSGRIDMLRALEAQGATLDNSCLDTAVLRGKPEMVKVLLASGLPITESCLTAAASFKSLEMLDLLLANGADINMRVYGSGTLLLGAALMGEKELAGELLKRGAITTFRTEAGDTAHDLARIRGHKEIADMIEAEEARRGIAKAPAPSTPQLKA